MKPNNITFWILFASMVIFSLISLLFLIVLDSLNDLMLHVLGLFTIVHVRLSTFTIIPLTIYGIVTIFLNFRYYGKKEVKSWIMVGTLIVTFTLTVSSIIVLWLNS